MTDKLCLPICAGGQCREPVRLGGRISPGKVWARNLGGAKRRMAVGVGLRLGIRGVRGCRRPVRGLQGVVYQGVWSSRPRKHTNLHPASSMTSWSLTGMALSAATAVHQSAVKIESLFMDLSRLWSILCHCSTGLVDFKVWVIFAYYFKDKLKLWSSVTVWSQH